MLNGSRPLFDVSYDAQGRVALLRRCRGDGSWRAPTGYAYDAANRQGTLSHDLTGAIGDVTSGFGYNPAGQIVSRTRSNDTYALTEHISVTRACAVNGLNQYVSAGPATFGYDANGNLTRDGSQAYGYDIENRLVSVTSRLQLTWDPLGRLYRMSDTGSGATQRPYAAMRWWRSLTGARNVRNRYVYGDGAYDPLVW